MVVDIMDNDLGNSLYLQLNYNIGTLINTLNKAEAFILEEMGPSMKDGSILTKNGKGLAIFPDCDSYKGNWKDGNKNGKGVCLYMA